MMKFKDVRSYLNKKGIRYFESEDGQHLILPACAFGDENFYDYGEPYKIPHCYKKDKFFQELFNDSRIIIEDCSTCCGCAGW